MTTPNRIFLVGPMGAGKTTIGRHLAQSLGMEFRDSDLEIQRRTGVDIPTIFEYEGEAGFRARERQVIEDLTEVDGCVLATGGGAVMATENVMRMRSSGKVVWLQASPAAIRRRMQADAGTAANRPSLTGQGSLEEIAAVLAEREPLYAGAAHHLIDTDDLNTDEVVEKIVAIIGSNLTTD